MKIENTSIEIIRRFQAIYSNKNWRILAVEK